MIFQKFYFQITRKNIKIIYETHVGEKLLITQDDYHPHNLMMGIIREAGLIYCIFFYYLIFLISVMIILK